MKVEKVSNHHLALFQKGPKESKELRILEEGDIHCNDAIVP